MARSTVKVKLDRSGIRFLLRSPDMLAVLRREGNAIAAKAGPGHGVDELIGANRARVSVFTKTPEARRAEATQRNLTRAVGR